MPVQPGTYPARRPSTGVPLHGWLQRGTARLLVSAGPAKAAAVVELGSWLGRSALLLAGRYVHAKVYCVDRWEGYVGAVPPEKLPDLYAAFLEHTWPHRDRIVPVRADTVAGMEWVAAQGVAADLVYIDADHSTEGCLRDLQTAHRLWPAAQLVGDDWGWPTVRAAVRRFARQAGFVIEVDGSGWWLHRRAGLATRGIWAWRRLRASRKRRGLHTLEVPRLGRAA